MWRLQRDNLDGRVLRAQFRDATNWISNVLIVVNVVMIPLVRLWMRFETSWPGGGTRVAFEKAAWIAYSLLYPLPYGFFMLLGAFRRSSFAFRMAMVVFPMVRVAADFCYYSFPSLGLNSSPSLELLHVNFGLASQYIASGSFSILTAAAPFAVASYTHATDREWLVLAYEPKRRRAPDAADDPESGLGAGRRRISSSSAAARSRARSGLASGFMEGGGGARSKDGATLRHAHGPRWLKAD